jgi:hypothetical protein
MLSIIKMGGGGHGGSVANRRWPGFDRVNGVDHLPKDQKDQVKRVLRAAWKMEAKAGMARLKKLAEWLEREYPSAAGSLLEGTGGMLHHQPVGHTAFTASLPGHHQRHRKSALRGSQANSSRLPLARRWNGQTVDGLGLPGDGEELLQDDGLSRSLGSGSNPQWIEVCHPTGGGVVRWAQTAALNFQLRPGHPPVKRGAQQAIDILSAICHNN